jgi:hypothetical protein
LALPLKHWLIVPSRNQYQEQYCHPDHQAIKIWCQHLQLDIENIFPGNQPYIQLNEPVEDENNDGI